MDGGRPFSLGAAQQQPNMSNVGGMMDRAFHSGFAPPNANSLPVSRTAPQTDTSGSIPGVGQADIVATTVTATDLVSTVGGQSLKRIFESTIGRLPESPHSIPMPVKGGPMFCLNLERDAATEDKIIIGQLTLNKLLREAHRAKQKGRHVNLPRTAHVSYRRAGDEAAVVPSTLYEDEPSTMCLLDLLDPPSDSHDELLKQLPEGVSLLETMRGLGHTFAAAPAVSDRPRLDGTDAINAWRLAVNRQTSLPILTTPALLAQRLYFLGTYANRSVIGERPGNTPLAPSLGDIVTPPVWSINVQGRSVGAPQRAVVILRDQRFPFAVVGDSIYYAVTQTYRGGPVQIVEFHAPPGVTPHGRHAYAHYWDEAANVERPAPLLSGGRLIRNARNVEREVQTDEVTALLAQNVQTLRDVGLPLCHVEFAYQSAAQRPIEINLVGGAAVVR